MASVPAFDLAHLEGVCRVLAETSNGLTGTEIGRLLGRLGISDIDPTATKWRRLYQALATRQSSDRCGNYVFGFLKESMKPVSYVGRIQMFEERRQALNQKPLATVVIGGIVSSTFLTLVLLPTLYEWMERKLKPKKKEEPL